MATDTEAINLGTMRETVRKGRGTSLSLDLKDDKGPEPG